MIPFNLKRGDRVWVRVPCMCGPTGEHRIRATVLEIVMRRGQKPIDSLAYTRRPGAPGPLGDEVEVKIDLQPHPCPLQRPGLNASLLDYIEPVDPITLLGELADG